MQKVFKVFLRLIYNLTQPLSYFYDIANSFYPRVA